MRSLCFLAAFLLAALLGAAPAHAQQGILGKLQNGFPQGSSGPGNDSLRKRNKFEDSLTLTYRYLDTAGRYRLDSGIVDFYARFPVPFNHQWLGNTGGASKPFAFSPQMSTGFDPGFHAYDAYKLTMDRVRFFTATRPYSEIGYVLGSKGQQGIDLLTTQNLKAGWNVSLRYRLVNSLGTFNNQNTNHNNYLLTSWYQSPNRRYNNYLVLLGNKLQAAENGGIVADSLLDDVGFSDRFGIPTRLATGTTRNVGLLANTAINTGNRYSEFTALMRQQYDLGRKDSLVTDSTVIPLFFPRLRIEHTFTLGDYRYTFSDAVADSAFYKDAYGLQLPEPGARGTVWFRDHWKELTNDLSIYQFPDPKNLNQYIRVGAAYQSLKGLVQEKLSYGNLWVHGEYRNRTRSGKWDLMANGKLHLAGYNSGDFHAFASLQRLLGTRLGSLQVGGELNNRTPSFIYDNRSNFYFDDPSKKFLKENTLRLFGNLFNPKLKLQLGAEYFLITNYLYVTGYRTMEQESDVFNLLRLTARKTITVRRRLFLDADVMVQQQAGNAAVHVPLLFGIGRLYYQGNLGFPNLTLAVGLESRYASPYKADSYLPVIGQFSFQDSMQLRNRPDLNAFFHFRIRGFKAFLRAENLNTLRFRQPAGFRQHNFGAPNYPYPGLIIRFGIFWSFVG
ncbi:putative porin [Flaviaesturariibacter flavus]|nr:putative porin [Flaviaesturariibacter flavus]